jgi:NADH:ubiquinone oxidoreductase subunit 3 (subunit A)
VTYFFLESNKISGLIFFSIILSIIILLLSYLLSVSAPDIKKLSSYECGFDPYEDAKRLLDKIFVIGFKISKNIF